MDSKTVEKVAKLARLQLKPEEVERLSKDLSGIFKWVEQLAEVDTSKAGAVVDEHTLRYRKDEVTSGDCREQVLKNAPKVEFDCFVVPKVIE